MSTSRPHCRLILGSAGTGKTEALLRASVERNGECSSALVLSATREVAQANQLRLAELVGTGPIPQSLTFYSLASRLVSEFSETVGWETPMILDASEQERRIRDLLGLSLAEANPWPSHLRPAVMTDHFVRELRLLISRCQVAGVSATQLELLGSHHQRPEWVACGQLMREYQDVLDAQGVTDYSELVSRAAKLAAVPHVATSIQSRVAGIYVDRLEDCDASHIRLLASLARSGLDVWATADPDQAVDGYRGATGFATTQFARMLERRGLEVVVDVRRHSFVCPEIILRCATSAVAHVGYGQRSPRRAHAVRASGSMISEPGAVSVLSFDNPRAQGEAICDSIRRAIAAGDIDSFDQVAVICRTWGQDVQDVVQSLRTAGIPIDTSAMKRPLHDSVSVRRTIDLLSLASGLPASLATVESILASPRLNVSPTDFRLGCRVLGPDLAQRAERVVRWVLSDSDAFSTTTLPEEMSVPTAFSDLRRHVSSLKELMERGSGLVDLVKTASDLLGFMSQPNRWSMISDLIKFAQRVEEESAGRASAVSFVQTVRELKLAPRQGGNDVGPPSVAITTAHQVRGRRWQLVFVCDLAEGRWPAVSRPRQMLRVDELARAIGEVEEAEAITDQDRRLFYVAASRANRQLVLTSVSAPGAAPSRLAMGAANAAGVTPVHLGGYHDSPLTIDGVVARLRHRAEDPATSPAMKAAVTSRLAALAKEYPSAERQSWWGTLDWTVCDVPIRPRDRPVAMSGSSWAALDSCSLRWFLEHEAGVRQVGTASSAFGVVIHAVAEALADGGSGLTDEAINGLEHVWRGLGYETEWLAAADWRLAVQAIRRFRQWVGAQPRELVGAEVSIREVVGVPGDQVLIRGSIDRLEVDDDGLIHVVDLKTKRHPETAVQVAGHRQLSLYQLAVSHSQQHKVGGAELVQLRVGGRDPDLPKVQVQPPIDPAQVKETLAQSVRSIRDERFVPTPDGQNCRTCPFTSVCPAH